LAPLGPDNHTLGGVEQITTHTWWDDEPLFATEKDAIYDA
jgi:hypothetical protein